MVVHRGDAGREAADRIDRLFHALADPTRRDIVRLVLNTEQSVSALAERYPMSFAAVQKHVAVLERARLVRKRRRGREQLVLGDIETLRLVNDLLDQYEAVWRNRIERMGEILAEGETQSEAESEARTNSQSEIDAAGGGVPKKHTNKEQH